MVIKNTNNYVAEFIYAGWYLSETDSIDKAKRCSEHDWKVFNQEYNGLDEYELVKV